MIKTWIKSSNFFTYFSKDMNGNYKCNLCNKIVKRRNLHMRYNHNAIYEDMLKIRRGD